MINADEEIRLRVSSDEGVGYMLLWSWLLALFNIWIVWCELDTLDPARLTGPPVRSLSRLIQSIREGTSRYGENIRSNRAVPSDH